MTTINAKYLEQCASAQLLSLYNDAAFELGRPVVKKFSDRTTAERRTLTIQAELAQHRIAHPVKLPGGPVDHNPDELKAAAVKKARDAEAVAEGGRIAGSAGREAVKKAIAEQPEKAPVPVGADKPSLPIASGDPAKDAEMPAVRRAAKPINLAAKAKVYPRRAGSKQALLVDMLSRPEGATFGELYDAMAATGKPWRGVTIRSGLQWDMNHIAGYGISSTMHTGDEFAGMGRPYEALRLGMVKHRNPTGWQRGPAYDPEVRLAVYRLVYPKGVSAPVAHNGKKA
jgi:hypothetical protein